MKKKIQYMTFILNVKNTLTTMSKYKFLKSILLILLLNTIGAQDVMAQLSSKHYLPPLKKSSSTGEFGAQAFYLSTPETAAFDVKVYQGTNTTAVATISISNTSSGKFDPPLGAGGTVSYGSNNTSFVSDANAGIVLSTAGFRFESPSGKKFYVNWRAAHSAQAASLVSAGEAALGTDFKWGGSPLVSITSGNFAGSAYQSNVNSVIGIMATEDNTQVSISGYNPACTFTNASGQNGITADVINITLNAGQSYVLEARPTGLTSATSPNNDGWLGATISSNKKIALNQGHLLLSFNTGNLDMSMTQITPTSNIGKEYVFIRGLGGDKPEFPVIIATENNTEVYVNNETTPFATLNDGQWIKIPSTKYSQSGTSGGFQGANMYIRATKNVYAFQTLDAGSNNDFPANADVFQVAPLNCLLDNGVNNITNIVETGNATYNTLSTIYLMIMASSAINANDIVIKYGVGSANTIPSSTISTARKTVLGTSDWVTYFVQIPAPQGDVSVYAPGPVAVAYLAYSGAVGVAGYFSGFGSIPIINVETTGNGCFPNTTLTATPGFTTYAWYKDGVLMPSVTTNTFTPTVAGDYYVVVYNGFCTYPSATKSVFDCNPEVIVTNTASDTYLLPGETTIFTIKVKLLGGSAAQNLQISNVLPTHLTYTSSTVTKGTFSGSGSNYIWNVGTMTNGEENILRVTATAQSVTSGFSETYITNNTQTFALGTEANNLADDKNETVVIYSGCSSSLAGTILGATSYCTSTNSTTLTASNAVGDLQWQSSSDNINFTNISGANASTLLITNLATTTYYRVQTTVDTCVEYATSVSIVVSQGPAYTLTSALGTVSQTLCVNTNITPITYSTTNTTGVSFSGLPSGVTGTWANDTVTISGSTSASGTFNYSISLLGTCTVTIPGSITVSNTNNTISLTSATGTNAQSIDNNVAITSITYNTTGATGATFSGLPMGITGTWTNNTISIAGTPTTSGVYNYTISLTGGCGTVSTSGTITVKGVTITSNISGSSICAGTSVTFTATAIGFTSPTYQWTNNSIAIAGANSSTYTTTTLSNNDQINVWVNAGINNSAIVSNGLKLNLDASNPGSYSGTGNTWYDLSGNNNHGTLMNSPTFDAASGSIVTNGTNQYISVPQISTSITNVTMQAWVYVNLNTKGPFIKNGTAGGGYAIGIGNGAYDQIGSNVNMLVYGTPGWINTGVSYGTAGWKLVTLTMDGSSTARAYVNGTLIGTYATTPNTPFTGGLNFGANIGDQNVYYNGKFAAAYFYNRALSLAEIQQNYNAFATKTTAYNSNTITISASSVPTVIVNGDGCINKTTLSTTSALTSYTWYKDNVVISGATSNTYAPTVAGDYKVEVSNGTCTTMSSATSISICGLTAEGKMIPIENATTLISKDGATNSGKGIDERGLIITKPIYYGTVTTGTGRIWLDRNLGASRVATSATDTQAFGDYYQWGRPADGHQSQYITNNNSTGFTNTKSTSSVPPNGLWIQPNDGSEDWLITANNTLWVGANPVNNPCPTGFRIPTLAEWQAEQALFTSSNSNGAFNYSLKLTMPGWLENFDNNGAGFIAKSSGGFYLTQTANSNGSVQYFGINSGNVWTDTNLSKRRGLSCRCIKD
jgi:uncharacterized protein (TIGR02145 family)